MSDKLQFLIEQARNYQMTATEREEQIRSFAYGNTNLENSSITRADIEDAMNEMVEPTLCSDCDDAIRL